MVSRETKVPQVMEVLLELLSGNVEVKIAAGKVDTLPFFYMYFLL